ncbi:unnamed protein product [Candidula unifasciata]|uniref:NADH dehydrogenase [ubiquinone] 1 alpha subcomplex assembly factor 4 n=1 Tax=Candidula unifasciata TaxID=100452 RepID=A0A8S3YUN6_9EUPU|nr:unnamed protein product [Candidula unifasciata]
MGQIGSALAKPFRNFNAVHRASKVLERRQKVAEAPPLYPSVAEKVSRFRNEHPEFLEAQKHRDEKLHEHLKNIHVESSQTVQQLTSTKALPLNRTTPAETDMGAMEAQTHVEGRASLKTVLSFLEQHRSSPNEFTASRIAREHGLEEKDVENVLRYIKVLNLFIPNEMYEKNKKMAKLVAEQMKQASPFASFTMPKKLQDGMLKKIEDKKSESDLSPTKI